MEATFLDTALPSRFSLLSLSIFSSIFYLPYPTFLRSENQSEWLLLSSRRSAAVRITHIFSQGRISRVGYFHNSHQHIPCYFP